MTSRSFHNWALNDIDEQIERVGAGFVFGHLLFNIWINVLEETLEGVCSSLVMCVGTVSIHPLSFLKASPFGGRLTKFPYFLAFLP